MADCGCDRLCLRTRRLYVTFSKRMKVLQKAAVHTKATTFWLLVLLIRHWRLTLRLSRSSTAFIHVTVTSATLPRILTEDLVDWFAWKTALPYHFNDLHAVTVFVLLDSGPLSQRSAHAEQYAQTKTNTNPSPDPNRYRRRCPDPNVRN